MYFARLSENFMSVCDKYFHFVFNTTGNTSSDFLQKLQMSGEVFSPREPFRVKFTPSGRVFCLSRPLAWTLAAFPTPQWCYISSLIKIQRYSSSKVWNFRHSRASYSKMSGQIRHKIKLDRAFMPVLVNSNFDDDSIKNERTSTETLFSH